MVSKDVQATDWFAGSTVVLLQAGLIQPSAGGKLNPTATVSYETTLSIFAKALGIASKTDDEATAAKKAAQAGFSGVPTADGSLTRIQLAKMLATTLGIQPSTKNTCAFTDCFSVSSEENALLLALKAAGIFKGFEDGSFRPTDTLTLAQVAVLVDRVLAAK
jgi:hypothetical protein